MSDLHATKERLAEALELERLRQENASLKRGIAELGGRYAQLTAVHNQRRLTEMQMSLAAAARNGADAGLCGAILGVYNEEFGPSSLRKHMQAERFRLFGF